MKRDLHPKAGAGAHPDMPASRPSASGPSGVAGSAGFSWPLLAAIVALGAALRLVLLGHEGLWVDEAFTAGIVRQPIGRMIATLVRTDDAPPLFYLLEKLAGTLFGRSETALRLLPALAGVGAVALLLCEARRRADRGTLLAAAFFAAAAYPVFYARQARSYGLLLLLSLAFVLGSRELLARQPREGPLRRGPWTATQVCAAGVLLCLTHHLGGLLVATGLALALLGRVPALRLSRGVPILPFLLPLLLWSAWLTLSRAQLGTHEELNTWMGEFWRTRPLALAPLYSLAAFAPGGRCLTAPPVASPALPASLSAWTCASAALACACLVLAIVRGARAQAGERLVEIAFLAAPLAALAAASLVWAPAYVLSRSDAIAFPAFALLIGRGLGRLPRTAAWGALLFWLAISVTALAPSYGLGREAGAKGTDRWLAGVMERRGLRATDWVIHTYLTAPSLEYYLERLGAPHARDWFPADAGHAPAGSRETPLDSLRTYERQALALRERMTASLPEDGAVWLLALLDEGAAPLRGASDAQQVSATQLAYPGNLLLYYLTGRAPQELVARYRQDWISGDRVLVRVPRGSWVELETLAPVEAAE